MYSAVRPSAVLNRLEHRVRSGKRRRTRLPVRGLRKIRRDRTGLSGAGFSAPCGLCRRAGRAREGAREAKPPRTDIWGQARHAQGSSRARGGVRRRQFPAEPESSQTSETGRRGRRIRSPGTHPDVQQSGIAGSVQYRSTCQRQGPRGEAPMRYLGKVAVDRQKAQGHFDSA